jgi:hypothetical protein
MKFELVRHAYMADRTEGHIYLPGLILPTLERPWIPDPDGHPGGKQRESCIPDGLYSLIPHSSDRFPDTYELVNQAHGVYSQFLPVAQQWGRTAILIHPANRVAELLGCIAPGLRFGDINGAPAVLESRLAMDKLRAVLGREKHEVIIRPTAGTQETP